MSRAGQSGFTFIEVLVASVVAIVAVVGTVAVLPHAYRQTNEAGIRSVLNHLATDKLEELRSLDFNHPDLDMHPTQIRGLHPARVNDSQGKKYYPVPGLDENYSLRWRVSRGPTDGTGTQVDGIKIIDVEATFRIRYITPAAFPVYETASQEIILTSYVVE